MQNHAKGVFGCIKHEVILAMNCIQHFAQLSFLFIGFFWYMLKFDPHSVGVARENIKSVCEREKTNIFCYLPNFVFYSVLVLVLFTCFSNQYHVHEPPSWT